jgi:O-antigen biosynthesis protein
MAPLLRILGQLPLALLSPAVILLIGLGTLLTDIAWAIAGRRRHPANRAPRRDCASVVIPNWNGRDLLEKYLPPLIEAMSRHPGNEIIVVDNGSTDGSAALLRERFPEVRLVALPANLGFGGGSNAGFQAAKNDIVVLLNSDMRVAPDFLQPLLDGFDSPEVFAVSCQIFFSDPAKPREETGLTHAWWSEGMLRVRHVVDEKVARLFPCFYGGGGSCAFDRRKFLELGGFDHLLRPFYLEDTDLGYQAWKRGWRVLYQPASRVWHEHRGTIGRKFTRAYIDNTIRKNFLLFTWKNIHEPRRFCSHLAYLWAGSILSMFAGDSLERPSLPALARAFLQLPGALAARWRARSLAVIDDSEAFRRPLAGFYRDRFLPVAPDRDRLRVLFLSPYPLCPPVHGGAVFMSQTVEQLGPLAGLHLIVLVDDPAEAEAHAPLAAVTRSRQFLVRLEGQGRNPGSLTPFAVREFSSQELEWILHRTIYNEQIDVLQIEYTNMGQYGRGFRRVAVCLFEHDIYFQSIARVLPTLPPLKRISASVEYLRSLRYELALLPQMDRVQTCTRENRDYLLSFLPDIDSRIDPHLRAGINVTRYEFTSAGREPRTMLFLGSFRHAPNAAALNWFLREVMPAVAARDPGARLIVIGSDPPPAHTLPTFEGRVEILGFVPDIQEALRRYAVFVCPILGGSGVRVKLLEAFASGIPSVSTRVGAEGLGDEDGEFCRLADDPAGFAQAILDLFNGPGQAAEMAARARTLVERERDIARMTRDLERSYREALAAKLTPPRARG